MELDGSNANSVVIPGGPRSDFDIGDSDFSLFARFQTDFSDESESSQRGLIWKEALTPLDPSINLTPEAPEMLRLDFIGILEESVALEEWMVLDPQPVSPLIFPKSKGTMFYRTRN